MSKRRSTAAFLAAAVFLVPGVVPPAPARGQAEQPAPLAEAKAHPECTVNLANVGPTADIVSNALVRGLKVPASDAALFLDGAQERYASVPEMLKAAAAHFKVSEDAVRAKVEKYKHCNCSHPVEDILPPLLRVDPQPHAGCTIDLRLAGTMSDVLSGSLLGEQRLPERDVRAFLGGADEKYEDGAEVFKAAAAHFKVSEDVLAAQVQKYRHSDCEIAVPDDGKPVSAFARNVTLHVVLHELGHALIREFDIPVLGNEETEADAFATYYLTTYLPDRAAEVLAARTTSLMIEASEDTGAVDWSGEHDHDARRANQIAALAVAADPVKYKKVADIVGMSDDDIKKACDYGGEIRRSWRRVLAPLCMPEGAASAAARVVYDSGNPFLARLCAEGLPREVETAVRRFDWHSMVTIRFVDGKGGAAWSRSDRTVTVHSAYVRRFMAQGDRGLPQASK
jgi:hypothetical protein